MHRLLASTSAIFVATLLGGCASRTPAKDDPISRITTKRQPYVGRYLTAELTKAHPNTSEVRLDGMLEERGPDGHVFFASWEPIDTDRIEATQAGASWRRVYTLQPPKQGTGEGRFTKADYTGA